MQQSLCVRDLQPYQRPREKCLQVGVERLEVEELLAILLRTGRKGGSVLELAKELLQLSDQGAYGLNHLSLEDLQQVKGIGVDKAITIAAAIELGRRLRELNVVDTYLDFSHPKAVGTYMMERLRYEREEHFCVALLTVKNRLIRVETISKGGLTSSLAEQRSVFRHAINANAGGVILIHNHPSGDPTESPEDVQVTRVFQKAGEVMGIPVLDHIIIGDGRFVSLCEKRLM